MTHHQKLNKTDCKKIEKSCIFTEKLLKDVLNVKMASKFPGGNGAKNGNGGHFRKLSDNIELPKAYPDPTFNGEVRSRSDTLASVQNLPAVLTDPRKGKS